MKMIYVRWKRSESRTGSGLMHGVFHHVSYFCFSFILHDSHDQTYLLYSISRCDETFV